MKSCCALRLALRRLTGHKPTERWTCSGCGQSFRWHAWHWEPISTAEDITDMMKQEHEREQHD